MLAQPLLVVDNCKEEIKFYQRILGGDIKILRTQGDEVLNAELHVEGAVIKFGDSLAANPTRHGDYVRVFLKIETEDKFRSIYEQFASGGKVIKEIYEAPFDGLLAVVTDRNGLCWVLSFYRNG